VPGTSASALEIPIPSPWVELLQEPPAMTDVDFQGLIAEPFLPDKDGFVRLPDKPGLGVELGDRWQRTG
jgi:L-alanine-DL-glutamate epimerase-like enolase superfamily enzyme